MSRIDDLIQALCPNGVAFKPLGGVAMNLDNERRPVTRSSRQAGAYPYYGANGIQDYVDDYIFDGTFLLVGEDGSVVQKDGSPVVNWASGKIWVNNHAHILTQASEGPDLRFLFHYLQSIDITPYVTGSTQPKLNQGNLNRIPVPVLPHAIQQEIIQVLDRLAGLEAELQTRLEAERLARQRQHAFVVSEILGGIDAEQETLRNLGDWRGGVTPSKSEPRYWESGSIPWLASKDVSESEGKAIRGRVTRAALAETSLRIIPSRSVLVVMRSNILRRRLPIGITVVETTLNQDVKALSPREGVASEYVFQVLRATSEQIRAACVRTDGSMAAVDSRSFFSWSIPLPSRPDQERIARQLNELESVMSELNASLSAEIAARRRQYEHYRDRLLTFEEEVA